MPSAAISATSSRAPPLGTDVRTILAAALMIAGAAPPAHAGPAMDNAIVALASVSVCPVPYFTDVEADSLITLAAKVERLPSLTAFTFAAQVADELTAETRRRGTAFPFCNVVRQIAATMPTT